MKIRQIIVYLVTIVFPSLSLALVTGPVIAKGVVKSFDDQIVVVAAETHSYEIPRSLVAEKSLKVGRKIEVTMSHEQAGKIKMTQKKTTGN